MPIVCCVCQSEEWVACAPGSEPEEVEQGNLFRLNPDPGIPAQAWCAEHRPLGARKNHKKQGETVSQNDDNGQTVVCG